jgi:uncharacterized protein YuzE
VKTNNENLTFEYDAIGDILYITKVHPYVLQESDEIEDGIIARMNPTTSEIESIEILSFQKRLEGNASFSLPIIAKFFKSA